MAVSQGEIRGVVVEHTLVPAVHRVAAIALLAVFTRMHIRRLMAAHAGGFFKLIALAGVTAATSHFCMETAQSKTGSGVIELQPLLPAMRGMTGAAFAPEGFFMEVIFEVAARALGLGIAKLLTFLVAAATSECRVFAFQRKACPLVAESINGHSDDVGIATQVIGVTGLTGLDTGLGRLAVKTRFAVAIRTDFIVAI